MLFQPPSRNVIHRPEIEPQEPAPPEEKEPDHIRNLMIGATTTLIGLAVFYEAISQPHVSYEILKAHIVLGQTIAATGAFIMVESAIEDIKQASR